MTKTGLLVVGAFVVSSGIAVAGGSEQSPPLRTAQAKPPAPATKASAAFMPTLSRQFLPKNLTVGLCEDVKCLIEVEVKVEGDRCEPRPADAGNNRVYVYSAEPKPPRKKVQIVWMLKPGTSDYAFKSGDGVFFKNDATEFESGKRLNDMEYQWVDKMTKKGRDFNYKIQVTHLPSNKKCIYDPAIVNDWP